MTKPVEKDPPEHLREAMRGLSRQLRASLGASSPLGDSLTKGELREEDVVQAFRPHLARRYEICKGTVVTAAGYESDPQDVVLLDSFALPQIWGAGHTRVVPVEGVVGTIQIKSVASKKTVKDAVENVASAKRLLPATPRYGLPLAGAGHSRAWATSASFFGGALFLSRRDSLDSVIDAYTDIALRQDPRERCDALCIVDEATVLWGSPENGPRGDPGLQFCFRAEQATSPLSISAGDDSLMFFYACLAEHLTNWITPPIAWPDYIFGPDGSKRREGFSFEYSYSYNDENPPDWVQP